MESQLLTLLEAAENIADAIKAFEDEVDVLVDSQEDTFFEMANAEALTLEDVQAKAHALETASFIAGGAVDPPSEGERALLLSLINDLLALS